ncbi:MAG: putative damage-inducible protein DinB [Saprospiraceae bacterium]|jgi:uncharacterized damage-inducible protein DinB
MSKIEAYQKQFKFYRSLAEKAVAQVSDEQIFEGPSSESNSIAVIMKHMSGNMLSRWTNIFESDGEKSWRNRDDEFVNTYSSKEELVAYWNQGWDRLEDTLDDISDDDLETIIYIRNMGCTLHDAIIRQVSHYAYHVGQIVFIARLLKGAEFQSLSIPKNQSKEYNTERFAREKEVKHFVDDQKDNNSN